MKDMGASIGPVVSESVRTRRGPGFFSQDQWVCVTASGFYQKSCQNWWSIHSDFISLLDQKSLSYSKKTISELWIVYLQRSASMSCAKLCGEAPWRWDWDLQIWSFLTLKSSSNPCKSPKISKNHQTWKKKVVFFPCFPETDDTRYPTNMMTFFWVDFQTIFIIIYPSDEPSDNPTSSTGRASWNTLFRYLLKKDVHTIQETPNGGHHSFRSDDHGWSGYCCN